MNCDKLDINKELKWGVNYRQQQKKSQNASLAPKSSPLDLKLMWHKYQITKKIQDLNLYKKQFFAKPIPKYLKGKKKNEDDRATFTKKQYINYLSTPHLHDIPQPKVDSRAALKKRLPQRCSPRLIELAQPTKLRVINTWNNYAHALTPEVFERLQALVQTNRTLDPSFARCCFKNLDKKRRKVKRTRRRKKINRKKRVESEKWLKLQILLTSNALIDFLYHGPLLASDYRQTLISDAILTQLRHHNFFKRKPLRTSKKPFQMAIVNVVDQLSAWIDAVVRYTDVQDPNEDDEYEQNSVESLLGIQAGEEDDLCDDAESTSSKF